MKMIDLRKYTDAALSVKKETAIQRSLRHPNVLQYYGKRSHANFEYIFLEYCSGGELFDRIEPDLGMAVKDARRYFRQLLSGVEYLHSRGVAHRDIKPENLLLDQYDNIKISDFGMATMFRFKGVERLLDRRCGTLPYVAPEVLKEPYRASPADLWSCGIVLVTMLSGVLPWDQPSSKCKNYEDWCIGGVLGSNGPWKTMTAGVLGLLTGILADDPQNRSALERVQSHPWMSTQSSDDIDYGSNLEEFSISLSQPLPSGDHTASLIAHETDDREMTCFSQPIACDDLLLASQMNLTQSASQGVFQKLVKRMTRFFVGCEYAQATERLTAVLRSMIQCQWKISQTRGITVTTTDNRKMQLIYKVNFIDMDGKLLVDFRLSKGCGLEFKRRFVQIKKSLADVIIQGSCN
ncbi:serine/threonine-protein kinase grp isoform X2 [Arctopsyche grandis]